MGYGYLGSWERYDRQLRLWGREGQEKLRRARILVAGVGGLGTIASIYLTLAGVGKLVVVDAERVEPSNLNRQVLYREEDIGRLKAEVAARRLKELNPDVEVEPVVERIDEDNIGRLVSSVDVVVDGLDNWSTRMLVDRACWSLGKPFIHAGVYGFYGQATTIVPGKTPCLRCIFRGVRDTGETIPVAGFTPGLLGVIEAAEAIKLVTGVGETLAGRMLIVDLYTMEFQVIRLNTKGCEEYCR